MEQIEGIDLSKFIDPKQDFEPVLKPESLIEAFLVSQSMKVKENNGRAFYAP